MNLGIRVLITIILVGVFFLFYNGFQAGNAVIEKEISFVTDITDGDTIVISGGDRVRLLGIDCPEKGEFYYKEGKARLEGLIEQKEIMLEKEGENKDRYGRLLRYIFLDDMNINLKMVEEGYAKCYFYEGSRYKERCGELEEKAIKKKIGIWQAH